MSDTHGPVTPEYRDMLKSVAKAIDTAFEGNGFVLLLFPFGSDDGRRINYISNARRDEMLVALKEIVARFEGRALQSETKQ